MRKRMEKLHNELRRIQKQRDRLQEKLKVMVEKQGVTLDEQTSNDPKQVLEKEASKRMESVEGKPSNTCCL